MFINFSPNWQHKESDSKVNNRPNLGIKKFPIFTAHLEPPGAVNLAVSGGLPKLGVGVELPMNSEPNKLNNCKKTTPMFFFGGENSKRNF